MRLFPTRVLLGKVGELYQQSRIRDFESCLLLIRRHPDLNWGKGICSPPPYRSAMPPKRYQIYENIPLSFSFFWGEGVLNVFFLLYFHMISRFLNSLPKRNSSFFGFLGRILPFNWFYSISKHPISKSLSFLLKTQMWIFSHKRQNSGQIGTINHWL